MTQHLWTVAGEAPNIRIKPIAPGASEVRRRHQDAMYIDNPATGQREHKMTIVAREQAQAIDAKAAPGLLRYRFGVKGVCISEDHLGNGFRINGFYEYLIPAPGRAPRKMMTNKKVGRLILHGRLKRSYARILELRKSVGQSAQIRHPRQSLKAQDPIPADAACSRF